MDTTFNGTGVVTTKISPDSDESFDVTVQPDGKIVVAGVSGLGSFPLNFAVVRYEADGQLDPTFNGTGIVTAPVNIDGGITALAIQSDGKIVAAGISGDGIVVVGEAGSFPNIDFAVVRYMPQGALDPTFNGTGIVTTTIDTYSSAVAVNIQNDGKIVVAGFGDIVRYHDDGTLDDSFNGTGIVTTSQISIFDVALQPDGKLVVVGSSNGNNNQFFFTTARYQPDGQLDPTFNGTGVVTTSLYGQATNVAIQLDGKLVVAGQTLTDTFGSYEAAVVRYRSNGQLDTTFNGNGVVTTTIGNSFDIAVSAALQADGKILVSGTSLSQDLNGDFAVARFLGDQFLFLPVILKGKDFILSDKTSYDVQ